MTAPPPPPYLKVWRVRHWFLSAQKTIYLCSDVLNFGCMFKVFGSFFVSSENVEGVFLYY